ncbi:MAG: hypothetical protein ABJA71_03750 [Ginsengibacter sp.]
MQVQNFLKIGRALKMFSIITFLLTSLHSCQVQLVPQYNAELEQEIITAAKMSDKLYLEIMNAPTDKKDFGFYTDKYLDIEVEINSILLKNETRPKAGDIVASAQKLKDFFVKAMEDHKNKHTLSHGELLIYNEQLKAFWKPVLVEEMALKKVK